MRTDELDYNLPPGRIATQPVEPRDAARMMVVSTRADDVTHMRVCDLPGLLQPGDLLIMNDTCVTPARLVGVRRDSGGRVEGLFLHTASDRSWRVMLKSNGRLRPGVTVDLRMPQGAGTEHAIELIEQVGSHWRVNLRSEQPTIEVLQEVGRTALPPYILRARGDEAVDDRVDRECYQTIYADPAKRESVAAPTAGLHFTDALLAELRDGGIGAEFITLHVGAGTFQPVATDQLEDHDMHSERFEVSSRVVQRIRQTRATGGRVIAVGTTSVRALESLPVALLGDDPATAVRDVVRAETRLMIAPPFEFRWVDGLLTNFHLPRSTLLALVAAMVGLDRLLACYETAVAERYRFYSYGDCMLILP